MMEKLNKKDVGFIEDALTVLMNLLHVEVHAMNSYFMNKDKEWLEIGHEARKDRSDLLDEITKKDKSQVWCFNKHSLIAVLGFIELGNRQMPNIKKAKKYYDKASKWLGIFMEKNGL